MTGGAASSATRPLDVLLAGFGGQGMLLAGKILAQAAMDAGLEVSWLPSYGPEMRGGTANVIVRMAPGPIGSPVVEHPRGLVAMNRPSLEKFAPRVLPGGVIVVNRSLIAVDAGRDDCVVVEVDSRELARQAGNARSPNLVVLGAWLGATDALPPQAVEHAIEAEFAGHPDDVVASNRAAFQAGHQAGQALRARP